MLIASVLLNVVFFIYLLILKDKLKKEKQLSVDLMTYHLLEKIPEKKDGMYSIENGGAGSMGVVIGILKFSFTELKYWRLNKLLSANNLGNLFTDDVVLKIYSMAKNKFDLE